MSTFNAHRCRLYPLKWGVTAVGFQESMVIGIPCVSADNHRLFFRCYFCPFCFLFYVHTFSLFLSKAIPFLSSEFLGFSPLHHRFFTCLPPVQAKWKRSFFMLLFSALFFFFSLAFLCHASYVKRCFLCSTFPNIFVSSRCL